MRKGRIELGKIDWRCLNRRFYISNIHHVFSQPYIKFVEIYLAEQSDLLLDSVLGRAVPASLVVVTRVLSGWELSQISVDWLINRVTVQIPHLLPGRSFPCRAGGRRRAWRTCEAPPAPPPTSRSAFRTRIWRRTAGNNALFRRMDCWTSFITNSY